MGGYSNWGSGSCPVGGWGVWQVVLWMVGGLAGCPVDGGGSGRLSCCWWGVWAVIRGWWGVWQAVLLVGGGLDQGNEIESSQLMAVFSCVYLTTTGCIPVLQPCSWVTHPPLAPGGSSP